MTIIIPVIEKWKLGFIFCLEMNGLLPGRLNMQPYEDLTIPPGFSRNENLRRSFRRQLSTAVSPVSFIMLNIIT
jgi:hypothetical protein